MKRREFITLAGGAAVAWPLTARAQQPHVRRIGVLVVSAEDDPDTTARLAGFRQGLQWLGWTEGRNIRIDYRFAAGRTDRFQSLAEELVAGQPEAILAHSTPIAAALQRESRAIPIVFTNVSDPIGSGFIASLARPGGNLTGLLLYEEGITGKWLAMLKEIAPPASYIDRILRGANAADLPVQAPTKYETTVKLKTAKALGLDVPPTLLVRADEVIE